MTGEWRFFIGADHSGHEYLVPLDRRDDWWEWNDLVATSQPDLPPPCFVTRLDGGLLTFSKPEII